MKHVCDVIGISFYLTANHWNDSQSTERQLLLASTVVATEAELRSRHVRHKIFHDLVGHAGGPRPAQLSEISNSMVALLIVGLHPTRPLFQFLRAGVGQTGQCRLLDDGRVSSSQLHIVLDTKTLLQIANLSMNESHPF